LKKKEEGAWIFVILFCNEMISISERMQADKEYGNKNQGINLEIMAKLTLIKQAGLY